MLGACIALLHISALYFEILQGDKPVAVRFLKLRSLVKNASSSSSTQVPRLLNEQRLRDFTSPAVVPGDAASGWEDDDDDDWRGVQLGRRRS